MRHPKALWTELIMELVAFCVLVTSVALLWRGITRSSSSLRCVSFFLIIALLGSLAEAVFVRFGAWHYTNPSLLGVPLWFPLAFGTTGLIGGRLAQTLAGLWEEVHFSPGSK